MDKKILKYILSFMLCLFIAITGFSAGLYFGFINDGSMQIAFSESDGSNGVREEILNGMDYSNMPKGIDRLTMEYVINKDIVRADTLSYIYSKCNDKEYNADYDTLENSYYFGIAGMMAEKNIVVDKLLEEEIDKYLPTLKQYYTNQMNKINLQDFVSIKDNYGSTINMLLIIGIIGSIGCGGLILFLTKSTGEGLKLSSYGLLSGGLITMIFPTIMLVSKSYINIQIAPEYMYKFAIAFLRNGLITIDFFGILFAICGICCIAADLYKSID